MNTGLDFKGMWNKSCELSSRSRHGLVTPRGLVRSFSQKWEAERIAKRTLCDSGASSAATRYLSPGKWRERRASKTSSVIGCVDNRQK